MEIGQLSWLFSRWPYFVVCVRASLPLSLVERSLGRQFIDHSILYIGGRRFHGSDTSWALPFHTIPFHKLLFNKLCIKLLLLHGYGAKRFPVVVALWTTQFGRTRLPSPYNILKQLLIPISARKWAPDTRVDGTIRGARRFGLTKIICYNY